MKPFVVVGISAFNEERTIAKVVLESQRFAGFRVYGRKTLESLSLNENGMGVSAEILMEAKRHGLNVVEVSTGCTYHGLDRASTHGPLRHGASVVMSLIRLVIEKRPVVFLGIPGVVSIFLGIFFGFWLFQIYTIEGRIVTDVARAWHH